MSPESTGNVVPETKNGPAFIPTFYANKAIDEWRQLCHRADKELNDCYARIEALKDENDALRATVDRVQKWCENNWLTASNVGHLDVEVVLRSSILAALDPSE
jgi:hypothetical protein